LLTDYRSAEAVWGKFAVDSPLEESGFEPSVPLLRRRQKTPYHQ
jgi:hypothetical protein